VRTAATKKGKEKRRTKTHTNKESMPEHKHTTEKKKKSTAGSEL